MIAILKRLRIRAAITRTRIYAAFNFIPSVRVTQFRTLPDGTYRTTPTGEVRTLPL